MILELTENLHLRNMWREQIRDKPRAWEGGEGDCTEWHFPKPKRSGQFILQIKQSRKINRFYYYSVKNLTWSLLYWAIRDRIMILKRRLAKHSFESWKSHHIHCFSSWHTDLGPKLGRVCPDTEISHLKCDQWWWSGIGRNLSSPISLEAITMTWSHMMTQGAAQQRGKQMGMTAAPCLSPPSSLLLSLLPFLSRARLPPSATGCTSWVAITAGGLALVNSGG